MHSVLYNRSEDRRRKIATSFTWRPTYGWQLEFALLAFFRYNEFQIYRICSSRYRQTCPAIMEVRLAIRFVEVVRICSILPRNARAYNPYRIPEFYAHIHRCTELTTGAIQTRVTGKREEV